MLRKTLRRLPTKSGGGARRTHKNPNIDLFAYKFKVIQKQIQVLIFITACSLSRNREAKLLCNDSSLPDGACFILCVNRAINKNLSFRFHFALRICLPFRIPFLNGIFHCITVYRDAISPVEDRFHLFPLGKRFHCNAERHCYSFGSTVRTPLLYRMIR